MSKQRKRRFSVGDITGMSGIVIDEQAAKHGRV